MPRKESRMRVERWEGWSWCRCGVAIIHRGTKEYDHRSPLPATSLAVGLRQADHWWPAVRAATRRHFARAGFFRWPDLWAVARSGPVGPSQQVAAATRAVLSGHPRPLCGRAITWPVCSALVARPGKDDLHLPWSILREEIGNHQRLPVFGGPSAAGVASDSQPGHGRAGSATAGAPPLSQHDCACEKRNALLSQRSAQPEPLRVSYEGANHDTRSGLVQRGKYDDLVT